MQGQLVLGEETPKFSLLPYWRASVSWLDRTGEKWDDSNASRFLAQGALHITIVQQGRKKFFFFFTIHSLLKIFLGVCPPLGTRPVEGGGGGRVTCNVCPTGSVRSKHCFLGLRPTYTTRHVAAFCFLHSTPNHPTGTKFTYIQKRSFSFSVVGLLDGQEKGGANLLRHGAETSEGFFSRNAERPIPSFCFFPFIAPSLADMNERWLNGDLLTSSDSAVFSRDSVSISTDGRRRRRWRWP
ncbi:hypothetical protein F5X98DRAFT_117604 [Xylaria grammica]|nr:hypothetical protein F5X98DRAFT_117604 [Xylaria grammica]